MATDACNPRGISFAWVDPHGKVHPTTHGHEEWALRFVQGFPDLKREADQEGDAGSVLLFRGWIRVANFTAIQSWDANTPTDVAWKAVVELVRDCAIRTRDLDPYEPIVYVEYMDISSRADVYSVAEFIERFGGRRESESFFEGLMSRTAATVTVDKAHIDSIRRDVLGIARAADNVETIADIEQVRSGINRWRARWDTFAYTLRQDLEQRIRQADRPYDPTYNANPPNKADAEHYLKRSLAPMWEFDSELHRYPRTDTTLKDVYGNPWKPPEDAFEDTVKFYLDRGYASTRDDAVREAERYHDRRPLSTRAEAEAAAVAKWKAEAVKWTRRLRDKARKAWATLEGYVDWLNGWRGGSQPLTVVHPEEENVPLAGFRVVFRGFDESTYKDKLPAIREGLERYRRAAAARAPLILKHTPPIFIEWTFEPTTSGDVAGYYNAGRARVNITPWAIGDNIDGFVHTLAHEVGHHVIHTVLRPDAYAAWSKFIRGDYRDLDLREALAVLDRLGASSIIDKQVVEDDPILYLQLSTLMHDSSYKRHDFLFTDHIRAYLDGGGDPVVRVPVHPITGYAAKNPDEAFCEAVGRLVAYGPKAVLSPVRVMLRSILGDGVRIAAASRTAWVGGACSLNALYDDLLSRRWGRIAASRPKYQGKKEVPKADGSGTTTVYQYGPRQVANRHRDKADRIEGLRKSIGDLRKQVKSDLKSDDPATRLTALGVALIDATYERVGNDESADNGHYGVTGWTMDHITVSKNGKRVTFRYTGKSGVDHEKTVDDPGIVAAIKACCSDKGDTDHVLSDGDVRVTPRMVNDYLREFDVTAKDLRGFHANREMQERLRAIRRDGPELPRPRKERDAILKDEFREALEATAEVVGHEPSTLRKQYLVPWLEDAYMKDGTVIDRLDKRASGSVSYFAYGSNMDPVQMAHRAPDAVPIGTATLRDHDVVFAHVPDAAPGGKAVVVPSSGREVRGIVYRVPASGMSHIDHTEGVDHGHYVRRSVPVHMDDGHTVFADTYFPTLGFTHPERPTDEYAGTVRRGLEQWGFAPRNATKTHAEREDEEAERLVRRSPKLKPSRDDSKRERMDVDDPDTRGRDRDLSLNYKDNG